MAMLKVIIRRKTANGWDIIDPYAENFSENVQKVLVEGKVAVDDPGIKAAMLYGMGIGGNNAKELEKWQKQRIQQGTGSISNKFVVRGCIVSPIKGTRNIKVTEGESYSETGISLAYIDGHLRAIPDKWNTVAAVPMNKTGAAVTYYAYLVKGENDRYEVQLSEKREGILALYRLVVPAGDTTANLDRVQFYDERRVEEAYNEFYLARPYASVALPGFPMIDAPTYQVVVEALSWDGGPVGQLYAYDLGNNGFKVAATGDADNIEFRWTIINPDV